MCVCVRATVRALPQPGGCGFINVDEIDVSATSPRNICFGSEYFGNFARAWFTLFQVLTGDSWAESVARPVLFGWHDYGNTWSTVLTAFFFFSFILTNVSLPLNPLLVPLS
jgi:hypothetical protein